MGMLLFLALLWKFKKRHSVSFFNVLRGYLNTLLPFKVHPCLYQTQRGSLTAISLYTCFSSSHSRRRWDGTSRHTETLLPVVWGWLYPKITLQLSPCPLLIPVYSWHRTTGAPDIFRESAHRLESRPAKPRLNCTLRSWGSPHTLLLCLALHCPPTPLQEFQLFSPQFTDADTVNEAWTPVFNTLIKLTVTIDLTPSGSGSPLRGGSFEQGALRPRMGV